LYLTYKLVATAMDSPSFCASSAELCMLFFVEEGQDGELDKTQMAVVEDVLSSFQSVLAKMDFCIIGATSALSPAVQNAFQPALGLQNYPTAVAVMAQVR
jgi:hypothetical protein